MARWHCIYFWEICLNISPFFSCLQQVESCFSGVRSPLCPSSVIIQAPKGSGPPSLFHWQAERCVWESLDKWCFQAPRVSNRWKPRGFLCFSWIYTNSERVLSESHMAESWVCIAFCWFKVCRIPDRTQSMMPQQVFSLSQLMEMSQSELSALARVAIWQKLLADFSLTGKRESARKNFKQ